MIILDNGDKVRAYASAGAVVDYTIYGMSPTGSFLQLADGQLTASEADIYTSTGNGLIISALILVNTDSAARTVNLFLQPSGGTSRRVSPKDLSLGIGTSLHWSGDKCHIMTNTGATGSTGTTGGGATITDDVATDTTQYLGMSRITTGDWTDAYVASTKLYFNPSTGTLNSTVFNSLSDSRFKTDITKIENAINTIKSIDGVEFNWLETGGKASGVIAQNLETVLPHLVSTSKFGIKSVNYDGLIGYLIESIKELDMRLKSLEE